MSAIFWAKGERMWHAVEGVLHEHGVCGRPVPKPRAVMNESRPDDDHRCSRCDRIVNGRERP